MAPFSSCASACYPEERAALTWGHSVVSHHGVWRCLGVSAAYMAGDEAVRCSEAHPEGILRAGPDDVDEGWTLGQPLSRWSLLGWV